MKKTLLAVVLLLCLILSVALAACQQEVTLTLYDTDGTRSEERRVGKECRL